MPFYVMRNNLCRYSSYKTMLFRKSFGDNRFLRYNTEIRYL